MNGSEATQLTLVGQMVNVGNVQITLIATHIHTT